ncbi:MAG: hypothetical protein HDT43_01080 [Ruminococcaceae bacterium]|nr:hypothetical protein [Oscillospiraceae bacterium]
MKKIKLIAAALALTMLSGCAKESAPESNERIVWGFGNADERGEIFYDSDERLYFVDFETMNSAMLCSKPNCTHSNENECSAFGMDNHPILYGDKLYFFDVETDVVDDEVVDTTIVYKAEPDGTNRVKVSEIEGLNFQIFTRTLIVGDKAYFSMNKVGWNEDLTASSGYDQMWFCTFDFSTEKLERGEMIYEGWCSTTWIFGQYDGKVIFSYGYSEEKIPYTLDLDEIERQIITVYKTYDTESGEIAELMLPEPICVGGGYYVYEKDGGAAVLSENGKELLFPELPVNGEMTITNGKLFNLPDQLCADLSNGKIYRLNTSDNLVIYTDGNYVLKSFNGLKQAYDYYKLSEKEYIGEAL